MDAISLHQAGFDNAIACLGTALTGEMAHLLMRYTEEVLLSYDADEAGQKATRRAIEVFASIGAKVRVVKLSGGKDPDEILRNYGAERFRSLLSGASNEIEFALLRAKEGLDLDSPDGKLKYLNAAAEILSRVNNSIAVDLYASQLSETVGADKQAVLARVNELRRRRKSEKNKTLRQMQQTYTQERSRAALKTGASVKAIEAQKRIVALLYANPDFLPLAKELLTPALFSDAVLKTLYLRISEKIEEGADLSLGCFADLSDEEMRRLVALCSRETQRSGTKKEFSDCAAVLRAEEERQKRAAVDPASLDGDAFLKLFQKK